MVEYTPCRQRGSVLGIAKDSVPIGTSLGGMLAAVILPLGSRRTLCVVCGVTPNRR